MFKGFIEYVKGAYYELVHNVVWPSWDEVYKLTIVVAIFSAIFSIFIGIVDYMFRSILQAYYNFVKAAN